MAIGGNTGNKKRKIVQRKNPDPFLKKEWYALRAPSHFKTTNFGQTVVTRSQGLKIASDVVNHRIFEANLGDLCTGNEEATGNTKVQLKTQKVEDGVCYTTFHGMSITRHKYQSLFRKGCSFIEAHTDVQTTDGYTLRIFSMTFTARGPSQKKRTCYAKTSTVRRVRAAMVDSLASEAKDCDLPKLVTKLMSATLNSELSKAVSKITRCRETCVRKVKVVSSPKYSAALLDPMYKAPQLEIGKGAN